MKVEAAFLRLLIAITSVAALACSSPDRSRPATSLAGRWRVELRTGEWVPMWIPVGARASGIAEVRPRVPKLDCEKLRDDRAMCESAVEGSFTLSPDPAFPKVYLDGKAWIAADSAGNVNLTIGRDCGDCGNVIGDVRWRNGEMVGSWSREGPGGGGRVRLTKVAD